MAGLIIDTLQGNRWIRITSNGIISNFEYVDVWASQLNGLYKLSDGTINISIWDGLQWNLSMDGAFDSLQVESIGGNTPANNDELIDVLRGLRPIP